MDEWNDGVVFNLSEAGLALSTTGELPGGQFHAMRVLLQGPGGGLETSGQIVWKSPSRKQAGVRFLGLTDEARLCIRNWISAAAPPASSPQPNRALDKPQALGPNPFEHPLASTPDEAGSVASGERRSNESNSPSLAPLAGAQFRLDDQRTLSVSADRRARPRTRIVPLGYIQMGDSNGGIAFNVSEGGVAITAAMIMGEDHLPNLRLQFPDADDWIATSGQIVWRSESGKEAGVRFVGLTGKAQQQLRTWIQTQEPAAAVQEPIDRTEEQQNPPPEFSFALNRETANPFSYGITSDSMTEDWAENSPVSPEPSAFPEILDRTPVASAPEPAQTEPPFLKTLERRSILQYPGTRKWAALALAVLLGVISWTLMRTWSRSDAQTRTLAAAQQNRLARQEAAHNPPSLAPTISSPTSEDAVPPNGWIAELPARPTPVGRPAQGPLPQSQPPEKETSIPSTSKNPPQQTVATKPSPAIPFRSEQTFRAATSVRKNVPAATPTPVLRVVPGNLNKTAVNNVPPPSVESLGVTQSQQDKIAPLVNSAPLPPKYTPPLELKDKGNAKAKAGAAPSPRTESPANLVGSVAVRANPYPAIRMSAENTLKKSKKAAQLQLGHLVSRVEPTYPDEAKQRGIEGTVTVHAVIGKNGSVESVAVVNGPPLLASAVISAVRQWRYTATLLAGQAVETEDDIAVTFQISSSPVSHD